MKWNILMFSFFGVSSVVSRRLNLKYNSLRWKANKGVKSFSKCSKSFKGLNCKHKNGEDLSWPEYMAKALIAKPESKLGSRRVMKNFS